MGDSPSHLTNLDPIDRSWGDLKRRKLLFKAKTQPANSNSSQRGDEWQNIEIDGRMYSRNVKINDLVK
jgi:hypothetical protein